MMAAFSDDFARSGVRACFAPNGLTSSMILRRGVDDDESDGKFVECGVLYVLAFGEMLFQLFPFSHVDEAFPRSAAATGASRYAR